MATDFEISIEGAALDVRAVNATLDHAGIAVEGLAMMSAQGKPVLHVCVLNGVRARRALETAGLEVRCESEALLIDRSRCAKNGGLSNITRHLAHAGIRVSAYKATGDRNVLLTSDNHHALDLIG